jgi:hypothetical protein
VLATLLGVAGWCNGSRIAIIRGMIQCELCKREFCAITNTHLRSVHKITLGDYSARYGNSGTGFLVNAVHLPRDDNRYIKWRKSLARRDNLGWSKGLTKHTSSSVAKISQTFKRRKIDNFAVWRLEAKRKGILPRSYPPLEKDGDMAFLIGLVLGDGNIYKFQRTESLRVTLGTDKPSLWRYAMRIVEKVFNKEPSVRKVRGSNCVTVTLYQNKISERLGILPGSRAKRKIRIPEWILANRKYVVRYLRGLSDADGSLCVHYPTGTYKLLFSNRNDSMIHNVLRLMKFLGFHPHVSSNKVQISRRKEVYEAVKMLRFRKYRISS